jgi:flagellar motor switch protein FliM
MSEDQQAWQDTSEKIKPFDYINGCDPDHILLFIRQEHPQTIALVLAHLEPDKAAIILQNLPDETSGDVLRRIATFDRVSPEVIREVERVLEKKLCTLSSEDYFAPGGVESVVEILNLADNVTSEKIINHLEQDDPELAEEIIKRLYPGISLCSIFEPLKKAWERSVLKKRFKVLKKKRRGAENSTKEGEEKFSRVFSGMVLNQDEIGQLLDGINAGNAEPTVIKPTANSRKIKIYDFKRPDKFSRKQIRMVSIMHEIFARLTTTSLSAQLRSMAHVHVASVDQLSYEEFIRCIPTPTTLAVINMDPLEGCALLEIDPDITFSIIERLFGGTGEGTKSQHELTDIECGVMEGVIVRMLGNLREAWYRVIDLRPRLGQIDTNPQFAQIVPPNEMVVLVTLETKVGDVEGMINLCIPYLTVEPIMGRLSSSFWHSSKKTTTSTESTLLPIFDTSNILNTIRAEYPRVFLSVEELQKLKTGDTFYFEGHKPYTGKLYINDMQIGAFEFQKGKPDIAR